MSAWVLLAAGTVLLLSFEQQRRMRRRLERLAVTDALTGLPSRSQIEPLLARTMAVAQRRGSSFALALVDLDHFKDVNDGLGHSAGDQILRAVGQRLQASSSQPNEVLRMGGDEFALVLQPLGPDDEVQPLAQLLATSFDQPFVAGGQQVRLTASIGVASFPGDAASVTELLERADWALYRAKRRRGTSVQVFRPSMAAWVEKRLELERDLALALEQGRLDLELQPQVSVRDGAIVGVEALARWHHPARGTLRPEAFIPLAEETGRMPALGAWVLRRSCALASDWAARHRRPVPISVNVSIRQIQAGSLVATVREALLETGLAPGLLRLEIAAHCAAQHVEKVNECMKALAEIGVGFALDDFGTGYGALDYVLRFPLVGLKIDHSHIAALTTDATASTLVEASIGLGRGLGLEVVAEGVETPAQLAFLRRAGCDTVQGYLLCPPLPAAELDDRLARGGLDLDALAATGADGAAMLRRSTARL